jgi:membrane fusion protein (multidrug efflux system)
MDDTREIKDRPAGYAGAALDERQSRAEAPTRERPREDEDKQSQPRQPREEHGQGNGGDAARPPARRRSRTPLIILAIVILIGAGAGTWYWYSTRDLETTDDAYTDGRAIQIAPRVSGNVVQLAVNDNEFVHAGQLLIQIDPRDYQAAVDQAQAELDTAEAQAASASLGHEIAQETFPARLASAQAQLASAQAAQAKADADLRRQLGVPKAATTQQNIDEARAAALQAAAQVQQAEAAVKEATPVQPNIGQSAALVKQQNAAIEQAKAKLEQAKLNLSYTRVVAPQDGWVTKRNIEMGDYVQPGQAILNIVSPQVWVTANFKETQLDRMRAGQKVDIGIDAYPGLKLTGHIDSVQMGSGAQFSAFPPENATGNFVKIVRRVPVKVDIDSGLDPKLPLPLGISVEPTVHLK